MEQRVAKKWFRNCIFAILAMLGIVFVLVYIFDPYFHFHKPFAFVSYNLYDERYTNDGISRHFEYDAIITGTSMSQNFKPSEMNALYDVQAVKETFSGAGYQEISQNLRRALERNEELKTVVWGLDYNALIRDKDWCAYESYPDYLYDNNIWNDVSYVFNKDVLYHGVMTNLVRTLRGEERATMDEYSSWNKETGLQYVLNLYDRDAVNTYIPPTLESEEEAQVYENVTQNIVELANAYPNTIFYLFYTPYSICYWDSLMLEGSILRQLEAEKIATELMLQCPNVRLYNFFGNYEVICDLNNYRDKEHYSGDINSLILKWMQDETYLVTQENYLEWLEQEYEFYKNYDYDSIYE